MPIEIEGGCYCKGLRYVAAGEPLFKVQCHCRECQYITGGHPNVVMGMPVAGFRWTRGEPKPFRRSDLPNPVTREFCPECGTHVLTRAPSFPNAVFLKPGCFDDPAIFGTAQMAIFTLERQPFHHVPEGMPAHPRGPGSA